MPHCSSAGSMPISSKDAAAWGIRFMPTPNSSIAGAFSNTSQPMPCLFRKSAVVNPPIPAPTMIAFMFRFSSLHLPLAVWALHHLAVRRTR